MTTPGPESLLERGDELAVVDARLEDTRAGRGGLLVVEGPAGSGKSALLAAVRARAESAGMTVRTAAGGELEREFAFGVVRQLLEPVVLRASEDERAELLAGAAAHAGPTLGIGAAGGAGDASFQALHGLYWLVAALAERGPLVLVIDDAHWADAPSLRFLDFLVRRAPELPLLVAVTARPREDPAAADLLGALADGPEATVLRPRPLSQRAAATLLEDAWPGPLEDDVAAVAADATGGNPLLLRELLRTLAEDGAAPTAAAVRAAVPSSVTRSVERRLRRLGDGATGVARALAVLGDVPGDVLATVSGVDPSTALDALREAGLVAGRPPAFEHPVVRHAVAATVAPGERDRLHAAAAGALREREGMAEQAVSHVLAAPRLGEDWVVPLLRDAAHRAAADGAPELAARRLQRAREELESDDPAQDELRVELALALMSYDVPAAIAHLQAVAANADPPLAARALSIVLNVGAVTTPDAAAAAVARGEELLSALGDHDAQAVELEAQLLSLLTLDPGQPDARTRRFAAAEAAGRERTAHHRAFEAACRGATRDRARELVRAAMAAPVPRGLPAMEAGVRSYWSFAVSVALDLPDEARAIIDAIDPAARRGSPFVSAFADYLDASWQLSFGKIAQAEAQLRGAREVFAEAGAEVIELRRPGRARGRARRVRSARGGRGARRRGRRARLRRAPVHLAQLQDASRRAAPRPRPRRGRRRRPARRRGGDARLRVGALPRRTSAHGPRAGPRCRRGAGRGPPPRRRRGARRAAARSRDRRGGRPARPRPPVAVREDAPAFSAARAASERSPVASVRAEAELELGAAMRRANQRAEARALLAQARDTAHRAGARALEDRAADELAVAGGRPRRVALSGIDALTPAERRMAGHAAAGLSNREIAETLFVTRKTVEATLGSVFSKLGIRSRTQLPEALGS